MHRALLIALLLAPTPALAQGPYQPPVQSDADALAEQVRRLGANPRDLEALLTAGEISVRLEDYSAAGAFFTRAEKIDVRSARAKAGEGAIMVHSERPAESLRYFAQAEQFGLSPARFATERGLAYDLLGDPGRAQRDYRLALSYRDDPETRRRYALSLANVGRQQQALDQLTPLIARNDRAAWRTRAFVLAMGGKAAEALRIAETMMPPGAAASLQQFFAELPRLPTIDRAFAVHFGEVRPTPQRLADARLAPRDAPLALEPLPVQVAAVTPVADPRRDRRDRRDRRRRGEVQVAATVALPPAPAPALQPPAYQAPAYVAPAVASSPDRPLSSGELASLAAAGNRTRRSSRAAPSRPVPGARPLTPAEQASLAAATLRPANPGREVAAVIRPSIPPAAVATPIVSRPAVAPATTFTPATAPPAAVATSAPVLASVAPTARSVIELAPATSMPGRTGALTASPTIELATGSPPAVTPPGAAPVTLAATSVTPLPTPPAAAPLAATSAVAPASQPTATPVAATPGFATALATPAEAAPVTREPVPVELAAIAPAAPPTIATTTGITSAASSIAPDAGPATPQVAAASGAGAATPAAPPPVITTASPAVAAAPPPLRRANRGQTDSVLARIVAGLSIPASELEVAAPARAAPGQTAPTAAERRAAERRAAAGRKAIADRKAAAEAKAQADRDAAEERRVARAEPARIWVQVAGGASEGDLARAWAGVRAKAPDAFAGRSGWTTPLRATNRVLAGPFRTQADARAFVNQLSKAGVSAFTFTSEAGQKITRLSAR